MKVWSGLEWQSFENSAKNTSSAQKLNFFCHHKHIHMQPMDCLIRYNLLSKISGNLTPNQTAALEQHELSSLGDSCSVKLTRNQWSLPSHPKQKMEEPETAFTPLLGLISVAYWWIMSVLGWLATNVSSTIANLVFSTKADREATPYRLVLGCWEFDLCHMVRRCCPLYNQMNQFA